MRPLLGRRSRSRERGHGVRVLAVLSGLLVLAGGTARAAEALVAVASNFAPVVERLRPDFERESGHRLRTAVGSTGKLYAQVLHGAPYDLLLAADTERPARLDAAGAAVPGSLRSYARGRLVLWSREPGRLEPDPVARLRAGAFRRLAIANPALAPYGRAARETLTALDLLPALEERLVRGENIAQTLAMVATGNAELGFVAASQLLEPTLPRGSRWPVPATLHAPIEQALVLLERGRDNPAARAFLAYLESDAAKRVIRRFGYEVD